MSSLVPFVSEWCPYGSVKGTCSVLDTEIQCKNSKRRCNEPSIEFSRREKALIGETRWIRVVDLCDLTGGFPSPKLAVE
ncbi:hypothetical protein OPV22_012011 [Ensete ventricosum]|uniref:Uncharacterized protein n=1 Tax=Ensete ventricosum TaxID=4639 RepID=A0AAV8QW36_ENSVE|nr:hypothetical protein OPV22_012011 [Ensete ventricosum]